jgi:hypothetical protein
VTKAHYGGWAIYPDEGSSHMVIEGNICYDTNDCIFNQHYGRDNIVRNNLFAFGDDSVLSHSRAEYEHCSIRFERNILISNGEALFRVGYAGDLARPNHTTDLNLIWDVSGKPPRSIRRNSDVSVDFETWQKYGNDRHSIFADPKCADLTARDFTLAPDSPASQIDFVPIDPAAAGPRMR